MKEYLLYIIFYLTLNIAVITIVTLFSAWDWVTVVLYAITSLYVAELMRKLSKWFIVDEKKGKKWTNAKNVWDITLAVQEKFLEVLAATMDLFLKNKPMQIKSVRWRTMNWQSFYLITLIAIAAIYNAAINQNVHQWAVVCLDLKIG